MSVAYHELSGSHAVLRARVIDVQPCLQPSCPPAGCRVEDIPRIAKLVESVRVQNPAEYVGGWRPEDPDLRQFDGYVLAISQSDFDRSEAIGFLRKAVRRHNRPAILGVLLRPDVVQVKAVSAHSERGSRDQFCPRYRHVSPSSPYGSTEYGGWASVKPEPAR